jgi:hypothetical protein
MIRKLMTFLLCVLLTSGKTFSQSFMNSIGANISILYAKINTQYDHETFLMNVNQFSYFPRITLSESDNSSVSLGAPLGAGIGILNSGGDADGIAWSFDAPLVMDYNMGCKSTPDNEDRFGSYLGAGFGFMYTGWSSYENDKAISYGPLARVGIRLAGREQNWHMTVGVFFKYGVEKEKYKTFGFNVLSDF